MEYDEFNELARLLKARYPHTKISSLQFNDPEMERFLNGAYQIANSGILHITGASRLRLHDREDYAQEAVLRLIKHFDTLDFSTTNCHSWMYTTCRNLMIDQYRRTQAAKAMPKPELHPSFTEDQHPPSRERPVGEALETSEEVEYYMSRLRRMSSDKAEAVEAFASGEERNSILERLNIGPATYKSRIRLAREAVAKINEERGIF